MDQTFEALPAPRTLLMQMINNNPDAEVDAQTVFNSPHGIDLGALKPSLTDRICTEDGLIQTLPDAIPGEIQRLRDELAVTPPTDQLLLIGRRHIRSNNSWMHNSRRLTKGPRRDELWMHPDDMRSRGLKDGDKVSLRSRVGAIEIDVQGTDTMFRGTVSLPHGWGHQRDGVKLSHASGLPGASANDITDERFIDELSGNSALNGVPVSVVAAAAVSAQ
jgi:anaerobic selenocysteine-containing dehydrogenase